MEDVGSEGACASRDSHVSTRSSHSPRKTPDRGERKIGP